MKSEHGKRKAAPGKKAGIIASIIILALLVALGAGGYGLIDYFRDRVAPGVSLGSTPVTGQDKTQVKKTIRAVASSTKVTIKSNGKSTTASLQDLHVTVDVDKTADSLLQAKQGNPITRLNPQEKSQVGLIAKTDEVSLQSDLNKYFLGAEREVQLPTVSYSSEEGKFVVNAGKNGQSVDLSSVKPAITAALKNKAGGTVSVDAAIKTDVPAISDQTAHGAADQANKNLIRKITITNGAHKSFTLPSSIIAQWTTFTSDVHKKTMSVGYKTGQLSDYLAKQLPSKLNEDKVDEQIVVNPHGTVMGVKVHGVNGLAVKDTKTTAAQVFASLEAGEDAQLTASMDTVKYGTKQTLVRYDIPNGDPWMLVDLSAQKAFAYKGTTKVKTFNVSTGRKDRATDDGVWYVHTKYKVQTMRGPGYVSPNVKWVTYFCGGEGFHTALWNLEGIAMGRPSSHGCVNMTEADAKWVYDFLPIGGMVKVIGATPDSAVRKS